MCHKAQAQPNQGVVGRSCVGAFPRTVLSMCLAEAVLKVSNAQQHCKEETWPLGQVAWPTGLISEPPRAQSSATTLTYSSYKFHGAPPIRRCEESEI
jgi:hypothetical protein